MRIVSLGSNAEVKSEVWDIQRLDPKAKRFEIELEKGKPQTLTLDAEGWPSELESASHGAKLHFLRLPSK
jgi:hypothetical protein